MTATTSTPTLRSIVDRLDKHYGAHVLGLHPLPFTDVLIRTAGALPTDAADVIAIAYAPNVTSAGDYELALVLHRSDLDQGDLIAALNYAAEQLELNSGATMLAFPDWSPDLWRFLTYIRAGDHAFERPER